MIKGTTFTVNVNDAGAALHVVEGAVQVTSLDTGQVALIQPGQTAAISADSGGDLSVVGDGAVTPSEPEDTVAEGEGESDVAEGESEGTEGANEA